MKRWLNFALFNTISPNEIAGTGPIIFYIFIKIVFFNINVNKVLMDYYIFRGMLQDDQRFIMYATNIRNGGLMKRRNI